MKRWIVLGGNSTKMYRLTKWMHQKIGLDIINGDEFIKQSNYEHKVKEILCKDEWVIRTSYNRILTLLGDEVYGIIFIDFCIWRNFLDALFHLKFKEIKDIFYYRRVKRPWVLKKLAQFGVEKKVVIIKNRRSMRRFIKSLIVPKEKVIS